MQNSVVGSMYVLLTGGHIQFMQTACFVLSSQVVLSKNVS